MNAMSIRLAETDEDIQACFPVMVQLRPGQTEAGFVPRVRRQQEGGYQLAMLERGSSVVAVAGFRIVECLAWGRAMYVDDLVTDGATRSTGCGRALLEWLVALARSRGCAQFHLDSGVQRFAAHRFYLANRMDITSHHFCMMLD